MSTSGLICSLRHMPDDMGGAGNGSQSTLECNTNATPMYVSTAASKLCNGT